MSVFDQLMQHKVIPVKVVTDGYGNPTGTEQPEENGFFEYSEHRKFNADGEVVDSKGILYLKPDSVLDVTEDVDWKFKDVKNNRTYRASEVQIIDDPRTGVTHHYEVVLI